jgi:hypothetical protein
LDFSSEITGTDHIISGVHTGINVNIRVVITNLTTFAEPPECCHNEVGECAEIIQHLKGLSALVKFWDEVEDGGKDVG